MRDLLDDPHFWSSTLAALAVAGAIVAAFFLGLHGPEVIWGPL